MALNNAQTDPYRNVEGILRIVKDDLCHRCGACVGVCPSGTLAVGPAGWPVQVADCTRCNICIKACSGLAVDYDRLGRDLFGDGYAFGSLLGPVRKAYVGHAVEPAVRNAGASGGVITQLLIHLLESGQIKGALVAVGNPDEPSQGKGIVARSRAELLESAQSRYTTTPSLSALLEIQKDEGPFALVGLPCQIHAVRERQRADARWRKRLPLLIGLFCHYNLPFTATKEAGEMLAPPGAKLAKANSRQRDERGWPHNTLELGFSDGSKWRSPVGPAQIFNIIARVSKLGRCLTCMDAAAEFADFSIGDPWIRDASGRWKYDEPGGWSTILVRTDRGAAAIEDGVRAGKLVVKEITSKEVEAGQHEMMSEKKRRVTIRLCARKALARPVPRYTVSPLPPAAKDVRKELAFWATRLLPVFGPVRRFFLRFALSPAGLRLVRRRMEKRRARAAEGRRS